MPLDRIVGRGAREHNLKDITVAIPRESLTVITGLSGSGKSSLAFDTIYAEGQRRYVESLSAYARQFLGQMDKPDVDSIEGLSPAISIDQKTTSRNPRSTVGTVTEIYDYLRLLWARIGHPHCHICGRPISRPVGRADHRPGDGAARGDALHGAGADRPRTQGRVRQAARGAPRRGLRPRQGRRRAAPPRRGDRARQEVQARHRGRRRPAGDEGRAPQAARRLDRDGGGARRRPGRDRARRLDEIQTLTFSEKFACPVHGPSLVELEPRIFSFNSPHGACPRCTGLGSQMEIDPGAGRARSDAVDRRGRDRAVGGQRVGLLRPADAGDRRALRRRSRDAVGRTCPRSRATSSCTGPTAIASRCPTATASAAGARTRRSSRGSSRTSSAATARPTPSSRGRRSRST